MPHSSSSPAANALGPFDKVWRYFSVSTNMGAPGSWLLSTGQRLCWRSYSEQDTPAPLQQSIQPPKSTVLKSRNPGPRPQSGLCGRTQQRRGKSWQLTSPLLQSRKWCIWKRKEPGWMRGSKLNRDNLGVPKRHVLPPPPFLSSDVGSQEEKGWCVCLVLAHGIMKKWRFLCLHTETESVGSIGQARKKHRECHFSRRHADGNKRHLRGHRRGPMTKMQKRGWVAEQRHLYLVAP